MRRLTIGKVARLTEVGVETIRFYEREGLIDPPPRRPSGYREYPEDAIRRIRFIRRAKELGFTLKEIKELLNLRVDPGSPATCDAVRALAEEKLADVRARIQALTRLEAILSQLVQDCCNRSVASNCPILSAMDEEESP